MTTISSAQVSPTINVGPLPSITPASKCAELALRTVYKAVIQSSTTTSYLQLQRDFANVYITNDSVTATCIPESYFDAVAMGSSPVFSSATACPDGYVPMCTFVAAGATLTAAPTARAWPALAAGDEAIGCCPSGYSCADGADTYACVSTLKPGDTSQVVFLDNLTVSAEIYANAQTTVSVFALKLLYGSKQLDNHLHKGLSQGQKAAIGVCAPLAVFSLLGGLLFLVRRRGRKTAARGTTSKDIAAVSYGKPELAGSNKPQLELDASQDSDAAQFVGLPQPPVELAATEEQSFPQHEVSELPGCDVVLAPSSPGGKSRTIQRKPVAGSPASLVMSVLAGSSYQLPEVAHGADDHVLTKVDTVSGEDKSRGTVAEEI